jgi:hypothetical protein
MGQAKRRANEIKQWIESLTAEERLYAVVPPVWPEASTRTLNSNTTANRHE